MLLGLGATFPEELMHQLETIQSEESDFNFGHVVFATGSGGTAAGIALGLSLAHGADAHPASRGQGSTNMSRNWSLRQVRV